MINCHSFGLQEEKALLEGIFGPMEPMSPEDFKKLHSETGIDIDGRISEIETTLPLMRRTMQCLFRFLKALPGYNQLPHEDKVALLKGEKIFQNRIKSLLQLK